MQQLLPDLWKWIAGGLSVGFVFSKVLVPAVRWWLARECIGKAAFAEHGQRVDQHLTELRTQMQSYVLVDGRLRDLEMKVDIFWKVAEKRLGDLLHRDDTPELDELLEKLPADNLSPEERERLKAHLREIEDDPEYSEGRRVAALILRASIEARYGRRHA